MMRKRRETGHHGSAVCSSWKVRRELEEPRPALILPIYSTVGNASPTQGPDCAVRIVPCEVLLDVNIVKAASVFFLLPPVPWVWNNGRGDCSFPWLHILLSTFPSLAALGTPCFP